MSRQLFVWLTLFATLVAWPRSGSAQLAPSGAHYAGKPSDTGHAGPDNRGGFAASIPLDLPASRGGLPIPISVVSGARGFAAVGVGWDIPLSYIYIDDSYAHRRPLNAPDSPNAIVLPREQVTLSLLGRSIDMVRQGTGWIGRYAPEVTLRHDNGAWTVVDGSGMTYTFAQDPLLSRTGGPYAYTAGLFLLQSIQGRGQALVKLTYDIEAHDPMGGTQSVISIDLTQIDYNNQGSSDTCFKHGVTIGYETNTDVSPRMVSIVGERVVGRWHKADYIDVTSRGDCNDTPKRLRRYAFTYAADADTQLPRLQSASMLGQEGTPEVDKTIPIATYQYASATTTLAGARVLQYGKTQTIPLPPNSDDLIARTKEVDGSVFTLPAGGVGYASSQALADFTGDGRPDLVFTSGGKLSIAPAGSGITLGPAAPLYDNIFTQKVLDARSQSVVRYSNENQATTTTNDDYLWTQTIDVNGDGRLDIVSAGEQAETWIVYLNTPGTGASGITWVRRQIDVTALHQQLTQRGITTPAHLLPLSHRVTGRTFGVWTCWGLQGGVYVPVALNHCPPPTLPVKVGPELTFTEYELKDLNGDGYPDFIFNSSKVGYTAGGPPRPLPQQYILNQRMMTLAPEGAPNQVLVAYNIAGLALQAAGDTMTPVFSAPSVLRSPSGCGVEEWAGDDTTKDRLQTEYCAFQDVNGDGLVDRIEYATYYLGTGFSFDTVALSVPSAPDIRFFAQQQSNFEDSCVTQGLNAFFSHQTVGLRDLTGDGIPDLFQEDQQGNPEVFIGTGVGFSTTPTKIQGEFLFSYGNEFCNGSSSNTTAGVYDANGDGLPDFMAINGNAIDVYQLVGSPLPGNLDAGRLTQIDNGYGATTSISYVSAKEDATTPHQVPVPEVVIDSIQTTGNLGLGGTLAATRYAYGNISQFYDSTRDAFRTTGYQRRVEVTYTPTPGTEPQFGTAKIIDAYPLDPAKSNTFQFLSEPQRLGRYLMAGMPSDTSILRGLFYNAQWLLTTDITTDTRLVSGIHYSVDTLQTHYFTDGTPSSADACLEMMFPYDYDQSKWFDAGNYNPCSVRGFLHVMSTQSWRGSAVPPALENVQVFTSVRAIDDDGRVTSMFYQNDAVQTDDDVCVDVVYATPTSADAPVLSAVATKRTWSCGDKGDGHTVAEESWEYDQLYPGLVGTGLVTAHTVKRHATDTGADLGTIRQYDVDYDAAGDPITVTTTRDDGATRTTTLTYDPFGLVPTHTAVAATGLPTQEATRSIDPVTNAVLGELDENLTLRGHTFDGFGRALTETLQRPEDATPGILVARSYLGFEGGARQVETEEFVDPVASNVVGTGVGRTTWTYFDELGRPTSEIAHLGDDYANETVVMGARKYDSAGRVVFEADPYAGSQDPTTAYGTTRYFGTDGTMSLEIRGNGYQPFGFAPDATSERFPTIYSHVFSDHKETTIVQGADSLTTNAPQFGVTHESTSTGIGRVLARSTMQNGTRIEYSTHTYDLLGQQASLTRYQSPADATSPVLWSWKADSLGQVLELDEPNGNSQTREYDSWGELTGTVWPTSRTDYAYDALGRKTYSAESSGGFIDPATINTYSYDTPGSSPLVDPTHVKGRLASAFNSDSQVVFSYDAQGNVNARSFTDFQNDYVEQQEFHADGSRSAVTLELPDNSYHPERMEYAYDTAGRLRWMWFNDGVNTSELYNVAGMDPWGRMTDGWFNNTEYKGVYANTGRRLPKSLTVSSTLGGSRQINFLSFDALGREIVRSESMPTPLRGVVSQYDALGRLAVSGEVVGSAVTANWRFTYDPLGNILGADDLVGTSDVNLTYSTQDHDDIGSITYGTAAAAFPLHDQRGNVKLEPTKTGYNMLEYYNSGNVRSIARDGGVSATFSYDPFGDLHGIDIVDIDSNVLRRDRHYGTFIKERLQAAATTTSYLERAFPAPEGVITRRGATGPWIYEFSDQRGTRFTTDDTGAFVQDVRYSAFGLPTSSGAQPGSIAYTTEQWNQGDALDGFGLVLLGKRVYDPTLGRFLSRDPLIIPRTAATTNPYAFAMNDPINLADPSGLDVCGGNDQCLSFTMGDNDSLAAQTAAAFGTWAADYLRSTGQEPPMVASSKAAVAAYSAAFDMRMAQLNMFGVVNQFTQPTDTGSGIGDFVGGVGDGLYDAGAGMIHMAVHPVETVEGIGHAIVHPIQTAQAIGSSIKGTAEAIASGDMRAMGKAVAGVAMAFGPGAAIKAIGEVREVEALGEVGQLSEAAEVSPYSVLRETAEGDAHHIIQDAAVRDLPGYSKSAAPTIELEGPSTKVGSPHYNATQVQRMPGGGTYAAERRIGYRALRAAGLSADKARSAIEQADEYFRSLGVTPSTVTRIPGNR